MPGWTVVIVPARPKLYLGPSFCNRFCLVLRLIIEKSENLFRGRVGDAAGVGLIRSGQLQQKPFQLTIIFLFRDFGFFLAIKQYSPLQSIAPRQLNRRQVLVCVVGNQMKLLGEQSIDGGILFRLFRHSQAMEPIRRCAEAITIIIEQGMLGGQSSFRLVEFSSSSRGDEERLEQRDRTVLIEIRLWIGDSFSEVLAE